MKTDRTQFDSAMEDFIEECNNILLDTTTEMEELQATGGDTAEITEFQVRVNAALAAAQAIPDTEVELEEEEDEGSSD